MWVIIEGSFSYIRATHLYKPEPQPKRHTTERGMQNRGIKEVQWTFSTWHPWERNLNVPVSRPEYCN